jgi:hypothetical protein
LPHADRERADMELWLAGTLASGERVAADIRAVAGPSMRWDWLPLPIVVVASVEAWRDLLGGPLLSRSAGVALAMLSVAGAAFSTGLARTRRPVYLAVTEQRIVAVQMRRREHPVRVLFSVPIGSARLTTGTAILHRTITCATADGRAICVGRKIAARCCSPFAAAVGDSTTC